jgi:hypothetical protein
MPFESGQEMAPHGTWRLAFGDIICRGGWSVLPEGPRRFFAKGRSASDDWAARLPEEKHRSFEGTVQRWEAGYAMFSISLNEAFSLRARGELVRARQQTAISADLVFRLAGPLTGTLSLLHSYGSLLRGLPLVRPLNPGFFRGEAAQRAAAWHTLRHGVLISHRSRFCHKLRTLAETIEALSLEYDASAREIADGTSTQPEACWKALDTLHYDMNTCLRECMVMLKSFLRSLPADEFHNFELRLESQPEPSAAPARPRLSRASR